MNIERMQPADFDAVYHLLTQSFPATERRGAAGQRALFSDSAYCVDILRAPDGGVQALIASWDFDDFVFLEHFAVDPACRSGGMADVAVNPDTHAPEQGSGLTAQQLVHAQKFMAASANPLATEAGYRSAQARRQRH